MPRRRARIADRHTGIGCDQLIVIEPPRDARRRRRDAHLQCRRQRGRGLRQRHPLRRLLLIAEETGDESRAASRPVAGLLDAELLADGSVAVDMGAPRTGWRDIPLAREMDTLRVDLALGPLAGPGLHQYGQPARHVLCRRCRCDRSRRARAASRTRSAVSRARQYRRRARCSTSRERIRLRVWERGAGITRACGSGACAALGRRASPRPDRTAGDGRARRRRTRHRAGAETTGHVIMTGPAALAFEGAFDPACSAGERWPGSKSSPSAAA